ncbi:MAG TPA: V-type ATPase subunit, partial [Spirochaetia bacterium]|nr:V-type ATPase subunit [Spirochaetia bacterium]
NARVRAMGSELLPNEFFEQTLGLETDELPMDALLASAYGPALREALTRQAGIAAVEAALRNDLARTFARVRGMATSGPRGLLDTQIARWDVQNVLAVLRGIVTKAKPRDIASALLPAGAFPEAQLTELALSPDPLSVARKLATWNYIFAFELHNSLVDRHGLPFDLSRTERRMYEAYYRWALALPAASASNRRIVRSLLSEQIDLANVKEALDVVKHKDAKQAPERFAPIPGGRLPARFIARLAQSATLEEAFSVLDESYFALGIEKGILAYGESRSLGVMERFLEELVIHAGCRLYRQDLLSISVPIGYLWRKYNETVNLRALCRGRSARMPSNAIRKELLLV